MHRNNGVATELYRIVLQKYCLLNNVVCGIAIDCCSTGATVALSAAV